MFPVLHGDKEQIRESFIYSVMLAPTWSGCLQILCPVAGTTLAEMELERQNEGEREE